jgi:phosphate transport system substrate-binding protein
VRIFPWLTCLLVVFLAACAPSKAGLRLAGSTSVQPLAEVLAEAYTREHGGRVTMQGGGSTAGVQAVLNGVVSLGAISRRLTPAEASRGLVEHTIGYDVLTVVVHRDNPVRNLTRAQLRRLFSGEVTDWQQVGGRPGPVHLVTREAGSGSREAFRSLVGPIGPHAIVQSSSGAIRVAVVDDPQAVGYVSLGVARMGGLKALQIDGKPAGAPGYALTRPLSLVSLGSPQGEAAAFIHFARSPQGQNLISEEGLVPLRHEPSNR